MHAAYKLAMVITVLATLILAGCQVQPVATYYRGYKSVNESATPLVRGESHQGQWQTFDMRVDYRADVGQNDISIAGTATLGQYYLMNTNRMRSLDLFLFFLDENSKVMRTVELSNGLMQWPEEILTFNQNVKVPAGASSFAFGYRGEAYHDTGGGGEKGSDGEGGGVDVFYDLPRRDG